MLQNHKNASICHMGKGEAGHGKYNILKLGGGHAYKHQNDEEAVVT
jgi:hypothetical protein